MLLTVTTTHRPATDLGFLLHKHPDRIQEFPQSFGTAVVFYPEAELDRCTATLLLDVDPVRLAQSRPRNAADFTLAQYVNDRPYAASSLLAVALGDVFSTARGGRCAARPELAAQAIALGIDIPVLPCRGGASLAERLFAPLGWAVVAEPLPLDPRFPEWGDSRYVHLILTGTLRLADALNQLYVLLPALDESKHYWQGSDEVDKLVRSGAGWLADHPDRDLIAHRYLGRRRDLTWLLLERLAELDDAADAADADADVEHDAAEAADAEHDATEAAEAEVGAAGAAAQPSPSPAGGMAQRSASLAAGRSASLAARRHDAVRRVLTDLGATSVIDLGCGPGQLLGQLLADPRFTRVAGCDVSVRALQHAARRLGLEEMSERQAARVELFQGALTYEDERFAGYDAAVLMEVIEHVDEARLGALERVVFGAARPRAVLVTTPNREYNTRYENLTGPRHRDHRFEWDRAEFGRWSAAVATTYGYAVTRSGVGEPDPDLGAPTQMAVFTRD